MFAYKTWRIDMSDTAGAEGELVLSDVYLDAHAGDGAAQIDLERRLPLAAFDQASRTIPASGPNKRFYMRGISCDGTATDGDATSARINRSLLNTAEVHNRVVRRYVCGITHPHKIRFIYPFSTTARGISIYL